MKKSLLFLLLVSVLSFASCNKDSEPKPAPTISTEEIPASNASKIVENEEELKTVIQTVFTDEGINTLLGLLDSDSYYDDDDIYYQTLASRSAESVAEEIDSVIDEIFEFFETMEVGDKQLRINKKISLSDLGNDIPKGVDLKKSSIAVNTKLQNSLSLDEEKMDYSQTIKGDASASIILDSSINAQEVFESYIQENIDSCINGVNTNIEASANLSKLNVTMSYFKETGNISGKLSTSLAGDVGLSISGDLGGKIVLSTNTSASVDFSKLNDLIFSDEEIELDENFDVYKYIKISSKTTITSYNDANEKVYSKSFENVEDLETFMNSIFESESI